MNAKNSSDRTQDDLPDGRNGHVVGENDDSVMESIGKAVIAPIVGADEGAQAVDPAHGRAARTPSQGQ